MTRHHRSRGYTVAVPNEPDKEFATLSEAFSYGEALLDEAGSYEVFDRRTGVRVATGTRPKPPPESAS